MSFNPNIPQPTDQLNISQGNILSNFQALDPLTSGILTFIVQSMNQPTASTNVFMFSRNYSNTTHSELVYERQDGTIVYFTASGGTNTQGWSRFPSNLIAIWSFVTGPTSFPYTFTYSSFASFPGFVGTAPLVLATSIGTPAAAISITASSTTAFTAIGSIGSTPIVSGGISWIAIGFGPTT